MNFQLVECFECQVLLLKAVAVPTKIEITVFLAANIFSSLNQNAAQRGRFALDSNEHYCFVLKRTSMSACGCKNNVKLTEGIYMISCPVVEKLFIYDDNYFMPSERRVITIFSSLYLQFSDHLSSVFELSART
jgi:hypothetical protein